MTKIEVFEVVTARPINVPAGTVLLVFDGLCIGPRVEGDTPSPTPQPVLRQQAPSLDAKPTRDDILEVFKQYGQMTASEVATRVGVPMADKSHRAMVGYFLRKMAKEGKLYIVPSGRTAQHIYNLV